MRRGKQKGGVVAIEETLAGLPYQPLQIKISAAPLKVCAAQGSSSLQLLNWVPVSSALFLGFFLGVQLRAEHPSLAGVSSSCSPPAL